MDIVEKLRRQSASDEAAGTLYSHTIAADAADEIERLRQDARRYRWLREQPNDTSAPRIDVVYWTVADESANDGEGLRMEALDAAIDAAMLKTPNAEVQAASKASRACNRLLGMED